MKHRRWHHWRRTWHKKRPVYSSMWQPSGVEHLNTKIEQLKDQSQTTKGSERADVLQRLLVLQTPRAVLAQAQMDAHPHGYHNREKRLYELIDFNDTFVDCVMALSEQERHGFVERIKTIMTRFCASQDTPMFTDEQFDAIVRGLSREIAVYFGAQAQGFGVEMTSRAEDAFGIDMVIADHNTRRSINVDIKTPSAFRYRLEELEKEGRITDTELLQADQKDFITIINRHDGDKIPVTILCVRPERLGDVVDFRFKNEAALSTLIRSVIAKES